MARRRGLFAELQYQAQQAERRKRQQQVASARLQAAAQREAERRQRESERLQVAMSRASSAQRARLEREAAEAHFQARMADVEERNASLVHTYEEIDNLLAATLDVDDYVDLEAMKIAHAEHPPFDPGVLAVPAPVLPDLVYPPQPVYPAPAPPTGLSGAFGGHKKHEEAVAQAHAWYEAAQRDWHVRANRLHAEYMVALQRRDQAEAGRLQRLDAARAEYAEQCRHREAEVADQNASLTRLINELAFDVESAIHEYVDIVLSNSVYPESFPVAYEHEFNLQLRELILTVEVPPPSAVPGTKEYRYIKARDEIAAAPLTTKALKDRYAGAVWQVAVRTFHEIFEADRNGKIRTVALTVSVRGPDSATGLDRFVPLVVAAADRETFRQFDLANVVPQATLTHLGAALSKSPYDLMRTDTSRGVRTRAR